MITASTLDPEKTSQVVIKEMGITMGSLCGRLQLISAATSESATLCNFSEAVSSEGLGLTTYL